MPSWYISGFERPRGPAAIGTGAVVAPFGIDGTPVSGNSGSSSSFALPGLTTTYGNDIIVVQLLTNGGPVTSITSSGLTWNFRAAASSGASATEEWYAKASSPLSNHVITINTTGADFITASAVAISGANFTSPFDPDALIPFTSTVAAQKAEFTTDTADAVLLATYRFGATGSPTEGTGWTAIGNPPVGFFLSEYKIVTTTQSATSALIGTGNDNQTAAIGDAVVKG